MPEMVRWPGKIPAGRCLNEIVQHHDWLPTFLAAAGEPDIVEKLKKGHQAGDKTFKVHLDGYNLLPYLTGEADKSPRRGSSTSPTTATCWPLRFDNWKVVFMEQRARARCRSGPSRSSPLRVPKLFNLRTDPYERADITSNTYYDWLIDHAFSVLAARRSWAKFLETFKEFPPRQKAASFTIDQAMEKLERRSRQGLMCRCCLLERLAWRPEVGDRRLRRAVTTPADPDFVPPPRSGSRSSTTTARCGARSRCRSSSTSSCERWPRWPQMTRRCASSSRGRRRTSRTTAGWAGRWPSTTRATTATCGGWAASAGVRGMTVEEYERRVDAFLRAAEHPTLGRPLPSAATQPMVELLRYLEANGFTIYIASGGDRDFMRPISQDLYGIPPERVIGSSHALRYEREDGTAARSYRPSSRSSTTARRSRCASGAGSAAADPGGGNSNGDIEMLSSPAAPDRRRCACWSCTTTPSASSTTPHGAEPALATPGVRLDGGQHQERLGDRLR